MNRRILCLYLPNWPIQRVLAAREIQNSEFRIQNSRKRPPHENHSAFCILNSAFPILLHSRDARRGDVVVACNAAAEACGVRLGMPLAEAAALAEHGGKHGGPAAAYAALSHPTEKMVGRGHSTILPHEPAADLAELAKLAERCERFSPIVGWETAEGPKSKVQSPKSRIQHWIFELGLRGLDCLFLDVTGIGSLFGGEGELAGAVVADCAKCGYEARVAVADTIGAAWALATQESSKFKVQSSKLEESAVLSTQYAVPSTPSAIQADCDAAVLPNDDSSRPSFRTPHSALRNLPLRALRLDSATLDLLSQLGIATFEQLLALPRQTLRARFGEKLLLRVDQLLGTAQEIIVPHRPPPQFIEEWALEYPAERREVIEQIVQELVRRIATALANRREGVLKLNYRLDCAPGRPVVVEIGLFRPSADEKHLWDLVAMQLEQARLPGPVGRVRLEAALTAALENRQGELFAGNQHECERQFALLIDRCSSRLGPSAVLRPELTADPLPERAVRYLKGVRGQGTRVSRGQRSEVRGQRSKHSVLSTPYSVLSKKSRRKALNSAAADSALRTPHSAGERPVFLYSPLRVLEVMSIAPDGPPVSFAWQRDKHEVVAHAGPERIEAGWWRGKTVRRDYWRVVTAVGQRFWLFRDLADQQWYLHGEFS